MAIETTPILGLTKWTDPALQDPVHPDQWNQDHDRLEQRLGGLADRIEDIRKHGAKLDGVTDDSQAIRDAYAALPDNGSGGKVGTIRIGGESLFLGSRVDLAGSVRIEGGGCRIIWHGAGYAIGVNAIEGAGVSSHGWVIRDLTIAGEGQGEIGLKFGQTGTGHKSAGGWLQTVSVSGCTNVGILSAALQLFRFIEVRVETNEGDGIRFDGVSSTAGTFIACHFRNNRGRGMHVRNNLSGSVFLGCIWELNDEQAIHSERSTANGWAGASNLRIVSGWFENNCRVGATSRAVVEFDSLDGEDQRSGSAGPTALFDSTRFTQANGLKHLWLLDGDFVFLWPTLVNPDNTTGLTAPDCAIVEPGGVAANTRPQTRIWWQDWRTVARTWLDTNLGANVQLQAINTLGTTLGIEDEENNLTTLGRRVLVRPSSVSTLTAPTLEVLASPAAQALIARFGIDDANPVLDVQKDGAVLAHGTLKSNGTVAAAKVEGTANAASVQDPVLLRNSSTSAAAGVQIAARLTQAGGAEKIAGAISFLKDATWGSNASTSARMRVALTEGNVTRSILDLDGGGDAELLTAGAGVILKSPAGNRFRVTVDDAGNLTTTPA